MIPMKPDPPFGPSPSPPSPAPAPSPAPSPPSAPLARHLPPHWRVRYDASWRLMRADRPIGWLLLLWPTLIALWLASEGMPSLHLLAVFAGGVWLTRAAGCVINDYADRWLDGRVTRTKARPLVAGELSGRFALGLFAALMLAALDRKSTRLNSSHH